MACRYTVLLVATMFFATAGLFAEEERRPNVVRTHKIRSPYQAGDTATEDSSAG